MIHSMNEARRVAFDLMRRQNLRLDGRRKGIPSMRAYFRDDVMGASVANALEDLGWLTVLPGRRGRRSQICLTDVGVWILGGAS
jgi:hypothetical protein